MENDLHKIQDKMDTKFTNLENTMKEILSNISKKLSQE